MEPMEIQEMLAAFAALIQKLTDDSYPMPDFRISALDPKDGTLIGEMYLTNHIPKCSECGEVNDQAFQDARFADGEVLCEFCYAAHAIEWERVNK